MYILFIEDEDIARLGLTKLLQNSEHSVDEAKTVDEAIEHMKDQKYDLVLLDVMIPPSKRWKDVHYRVTGKTLLCKLRKGNLEELKTDKDVPVVVITAVSDVDINLAINGFENTCILHKPIDPEDAFSEICRFLKGINNG
jgi:CheY-like chemotaxis protein